MLLPLQDYTLPQVAYSAYESPLKQWLYAIKYEGQAATARALGVYLGRWALEHWPRPQFLLPIPLHPQRALERGFNQSELLAQGMAQVMHAQVLPLLERQIETPPLYTLSAPERRQRLQGAFRVNAALSKKVSQASLLLVDDIFTTGSTVCAAAELILPLSRRLASLSLALTLSD